jgi:hypothetical protein
MKCSPFSRLSNVTSVTVPSLVVECLSEQGRCHTGFVGRLFSASYASKAIKSSGPFCLLNSIEGSGEKVFVLR